MLVESGVGKALANMLQMIDLPLLPAAFIISLALRASQGSATVAILTTGGLLSEAVMGLNPIQCVLVTLAACFGGLGASHINDSGFWIVTKYLGLSVADGLKTSTVLTTILGFTGFLITVRMGGNLTLIKGPMGIGPLFSAYLPPAAAGCSAPSARHQYLSVSCGTLRDNVRGWCGVAVRYRAV